jgi:hypothetical protein
MKGNLRAPIWIIPVLVLVMAIGAFAAVVALNHSTAPLAEADIKPDSVKVTLTDTDVGELSGYTITAIVGVTSVVPTNMIRVTFPAGTTGPEELADLMNATSITMGDGVAPPDQAAAVISATYTNLEELVVTLMPPAAFVVEETMVIVFPESAGIINPTNDGVTDTFSVLHVGFGPAAVSADFDFDKKVRDVSASLFPDDPGDHARLRYEFTTSISGGLKPGDEIILTLEDDFGFEVVTPLVLSLINISASKVNGPDPDPDDDTTTGSCATGGSPILANETRNPTGVNVDFTGGENDLLQITVTVPDMSSDDGSGTNSICANATVTVIFQQGAGIVNAHEAGAYPTMVRTTADDTEARISPGTVVRARLELADNDDDRYSKEPLLILGIEGNEGVTVWLDFDGDGIRDADEFDLCNMLADRDDTAQCEIILNNPPFFPGLHGPGGSCELPNMVNCNFINFVGSEGRTTGSPLELTQEQVNRQTMNLLGNINISPRAANVGDTVTVSLFDFPSNAPIDLIQVLTGLNVSPSNLPLLTGPSGEVSFGWTIPGVAPACIPYGTGLPSTGVCVGKGDNNPDAGVRVPTGLRRIDIFTGESGNDDTKKDDNDANLTIAGANLSLSHDSVIANQDLTISGNGFSEAVDGTDICVVEGKITIGNVAIAIDDDNDCPHDVLNAAGVAAGVSVRKGILLTSGGTFTITVRVHDPVGSTPKLSTSLLNEATHELKVIDTNGAEGVLEITIAERSLQVTPASARPRDVVTIIGRNFIADNADGLASTVPIEYVCGSSSRTVTADPDVSGNFRESLRIPSGCSIPSTNTLTARISAGGTLTGVVETVTHEIPEGLISITPARGASGTLVTVTGEGFRTFETVERVEFSGLTTLGGRTVNTDNNGDFEIQGLLVPGLDPGIHAVKVEVSTGTNRTTSSTSFEVLETGLIGAPTPIADVYAMSESLLRIFRFDNNTKTWEFNDPREEFADANTLDELVTGGVYWLLIDQDVELDVIGVLLNLTCTGDDCWNLVVWP